jgi:hypothetical protein
VVNDGQMWSAAETQEELVNNLDKICSMKLDYDLHSNTGESILIAETPFFLN